MLNRIGNSRPNKDDRGFTLIETMVAIVIIAAVVVSQASLLVLGAQAQERLSNQRLASSVLQSEMENYQVAPWDDLMMAPTMGSSGASPPLCNLGTNSLRSSAQIIRPESVRREEDTTFVITRSVVWTATQDPVQCDVLPNDRGDTKTLTITVTWRTGNGEERIERQRTGSVIISRHRTNQKEIVL